MATTTITVPEFFQGQTGMGQGGFTACRFVQAIGEPLTVAFRSPIPLETALDVIELNDRWLLVDPAAPDVSILEGTRWEANYSATTAVSVAEADRARNGFVHDETTHPAPLCWSCGLTPTSMRVHAGPLDDGRWATPWRAPDWAIDDGGAIDPAAVWASVDCATAWFIGGVEARRVLTVQYAVEIASELRAGEDYALVAWAGDYPDGWDGRKRGGAAELFDGDGRSVARSRSFWLSV